MRRRVQNSGNGGGGTSSATDTEWSDAEERATHRRLLFKRKVDDGAAACARGDFSSALNLYEEAIRLDPTNHVLYTNRSAIFCKLGRFEEALNDAEKSLQLNPTWVKAFYRKGFALRSMGRLIAALSAYASGLAQDSKNWQLLSGLIECMSQSEMKDGFLDVYEELKYLGLEKSSFVLVSVVGQEVLNAGHTAEAISILECALRIGTTSLKLRQSVLSALSTAYYGMHELEKARQFMEEDATIAVSLGDFMGEARAQGNLGMVSLASGKLRDALNHYQRQLSLFGQTDTALQSAATLSTLGQIYRRVFEYETSLAHHEQCLDVLRDHSNLVESDVALSQLYCQQFGYVGDAHLASGRIEEAAKYFRAHLDAARSTNGGGSRAEEIKALSELGAVEQARHRWDEAVTNYARALAVAKEERNRTAEASLCCNLSMVYEAKGKYEAARKWADRALALSLSMCDQYGEAKACGHLAMVELKSGSSIENAKKLFRRQLDMATKLGDQSMAMKSYRGLGVAHASSSSTTDALRCHKMELSLAKDAGDRYSEATAHGYLGCLYEKTGDFRTAETHFVAQLDLSRETGNTRLDMTCMRNLGCHYTNEYYSGTNDEKFDEGVEHLKKFLMLAQEQNDLEAESTACTWLGRAHESCGRYKEATRYYDQSLSLAKESRDHRSMAEAYGHLGRVKTTVGEYDEALECHKYSLALAHILNDAEWKLRALAGIGDVVLANGKPQVAVKVFAKQLSLAKSVGNKRSEAIAYGRMGRCYCRISGKVSKASSLFAQELASYEQLGDVDGQVEAHGNLAELYELEGRTEMALRAIDRQLQLTRSNGGQSPRAHRREADAYKRMGDLCCRAGLTDRALEFFGHRRRLLETRRSEATASMDYARCALAAGDELEAARTLDEVLENMANDDGNGLVNGHEAGRLHRERAWAWFRLGNYAKAAESLETALDYLDRGVAEAGVKCQCYRGLAALELAQGRVESSLAQLNRRLQFARSVGFAEEEPRALCDLAYVYARAGRSEAAVRMIDEASALGGNDRETQFRALLIRAMVKNDGWEKCLEAVTGDADRSIMVLGLQASAQLQSSPIKAGQSIDRAMDLLANIVDQRLAVFIKTLSAVRFWLLKDVQAARSEFSAAIEILESQSHRKSLQLEPPLFDEDLLADMGDACLVLSLMFLASQKLDDEALAVAEKLRYLRGERFMKYCGLRTSISADSSNMREISKRLKVTLDDLKETVVYMIRVEEIVFVWILTGGFRMLTTHRVWTTNEEESMDQTPTPCLDALKLRYPFSDQIAGLIDRLIARDCFNGSPCAPSKPRQILDGALRTSMAHDSRSPAVIGYGSMVAIGEQSSIPINRCALLEWNWTCGMEKAAAVDGTAGNGSLVVVVDTTGDRRELSGMDETEYVQGSTSKAIVLSRMVGRRFVHLRAVYSEDRGALVIGNEDHIDEDDATIDAEDAARANVTSRLIVIDLEDETDCSLDSYEGLLRVCTGFVLGGAQRVIVCKEANTEFWRAFYRRLITADGSTVEEALERAGVEVGSRPSLIMLGDDRGTTKMDTTGPSASESLRLMLRTPEECREALRVVLHLVEKALQRISAGVSTPMFTSEQSVRNKGGPEVGGCVELLVAMGFERGEARNGNGGGGIVVGSNKLTSPSDALYFPCKDENGRLASGSGAIQALLGLPQTALFAFSKLLAAADSNSYSADVLQLIDGLGQSLISAAGGIQMEEEVPSWLWSMAGVSELLAALGFDKMGEVDGSMLVKTIRMELTRKKVALAFVALKAVLDEDSNPRRRLQPPPPKPTRTTEPSSQQPQRESVSSWRVPCESAGDLSGVDSDFSPADVNLVKRCRSGGSSGGGGSAAAASRKRGKRGKRACGGGYLSEGEVKDSGSARRTDPQALRGYWSEEEERAAAAASTGARVISVDERDSPDASDDERQNGNVNRGAIVGFPVENIIEVPPASRVHEYARLETPTPPYARPIHVKPLHPPPPYRPPPPVVHDLQAPWAVRQAAERLVSRPPPAYPPPPYGAPRGGGHYAVGGY